MDTRIYDKLSRIEKTNNYRKDIAYYGSTSNVKTIIHSGNTSKGFETITQTFEYADSAVEGSLIKSIQLS
jgi:hypothetical protein